jgi:hypothetical protein
MVDAATIICWAKRANKHKIEALSPKIRDSNFQIVEGRVNIFIPL